MVKKNNNNDDDDSDSCEELMDEFIGNSIDETTGKSLLFRLNEKKCFDKDILESLKE